MSTLTRTIRNLRRVGIRDAAHQMQYIGDTKAGKLIGTDGLGNKYFENLEEELPCKLYFQLFSQLTFADDCSENEMGRLRQLRVQSVSQYPR